MLNPKEDLETLDELMPEPMIESGYDCPVCVGLPMDKLKFALSGRSFTLDGCKGCGGIWFDAGEMKWAADLSSDKFLGEEESSLRLASRPMICQGCGDLMGRNSHQCPSCNWKNVLDCPVCETPMERRSIANLVIDICSSCEGTWLDRVELRSIEHLSKSQDFDGDFQRSSNRLSTGTSGFNSNSSSFGPIDAIDGANIVVEILAHTPEAGSALVEASSGLVEVLGAGLEAAPELAGAVVEGIAGLLAALFSGL